ncbi:hypothetical protein FH608_043335 [Nonomuraea phyllanthi]|uniref:Uncharacterized protein n=1 Tax=Nonomuraea phyllanthi TaxID=2219224 RepID=A0A5C4VDJ5_9ACTN|nr:hypothetical protein [Nonomuraea phyllanthi]KAB8188599.1 hypothetical protein FH608_043335 [Nonomuraea phyllanthi]QFY13357.1 hypothetical protein GBF35_48395 [Nonomuraea phyllanthi]
MEGNIMNSASETAWRDFGGDIIEPGSAAYESAGRSMLVSGSPTFVMLPESVADVQAGVRFAVSTELAPSIPAGAALRQ